MTDLLTLTAEEQALENIRAAQIAEYARRAQEEWDVGRADREAVYKAERKAFEERGGFDVYVDVDHVELSIGDAMDQSLSLNRRELDNLIAALTKARGDM